MTQTLAILWFVLCTQVLFANDPGQGGRPDHRLVLSGLRGSSEDQGAEIRRLQEALQKATDVLGADHPDTLAAGHNLALAYLKAGRFDKAIPLLNQTLQKREDKLGGDHPETIRTISDLAKAYADYGEPVQAIALYEKALVRTNSIFPEPAIRDTLVNDLALALQAAGKLDHARALFEANLVRRKAKLGSDHPLTLAAMGNLGSAYRASGKLDKAVPLFEQTLKKQTVTIGPDHPETLKTLGALAEAQLALKSYDKAEVMARTLLERKRRKIASLSNFAQIDRELFGLCDVQSLLAECMLRQNRFLEAEVVLRECLAVRTKKQADAWRTSDTRSMLGEVLCGLGKYAEAEPLLLAGYKGIKDRQTTKPPPPKARLADAGGRLLRFYEAVGRRTEADKLRKELAAGRQ
jgi:tetratricopeptide (TPR) repeat protein